MAHGRNYYFGGSSRLGEKPTKTRTYRSVSPTGARKKKSFRDQPVFKSPMALYYLHDGNWLWHAVVDGENMPDWAKNYTAVPAEVI